MKPKIKKTFLTAALVCFLTGVSEQIEFAFLFAAPYLFILHAVLSGAAMWLTYELDIHHGFSYSAGAIDFFLNLHLSHHAWLLIPIGIGYGFVYYFLFRWAIRRFQIPTPGREEGSNLEDWAGSIPYQAPLILEALGGKDNIVQVESCITRLRLTVKNDRLVDGNALKLLGSAGLIKLGGGNVQVVFGTYSELIREEVNKLLQRDLPRVLFSALRCRAGCFRSRKCRIRFSRRSWSATGSPSCRSAGNWSRRVYGTIVHVYPTMHAIGISTPDGLEVLLHIGIDTSQLKGGHFSAVVKEGDAVEPGQLLVKFDLAYIKAHATSIATPMVITNPDRVKSWSFAPFKTVKKGQTSVMSVVLHDRNVGGLET